MTLIQEYESLSSILSDTDESEAIDILTAPMHEPVGGIGKIIDDHIGKRIAIKRRLRGMKVQNYLLRSSGLSTSKKIFRGLFGKFRVFSRVICRCMTMNFLGIGDEQSLLVVID